MSSKLITASLLLGVFIFSAACDPTSAPADPLDQGPDVRSMTITPAEVTFDPADGFKDTTLTLLLQAVIYGDEDITRGYVIRTKDTQGIVGQGVMDQANTQTILPVYQTQFQLLTTTTSFEDYIVEVFAFDESGNGNYVQKGFSITGFSNNRPVILDVLSPDSVDLPSSGSEVVRFIAKATDDDGQATIGNVFLRLISRNTGELSGSPFSLVDDATSGDEVANDSLFTTSFNISSGNNPETYDVEYFALDKGGLFSDTVRTTFTIRGN